MEIDQIYQKNQLFTTVTHRAKSESRVISKSKGVMGKTGKSGKSGKSIGKDFKKEVSDLN